MAPATPRGAGRGRPRGCSWPPRLVASRLRRSAVAPPRSPPPTFKQLTFRRGWLDQARFAPDGRTVIYGAGWDGKPVELFQTRTDSPESRPLGLVHAKVLSISSQGQMAILLDPSRRRGYFALGTLAVVPLAGGTPRELLENVMAADWTPDGRDLCVSRLHPNGEITIELPPGTVLPGPRARACVPTCCASPGRSPRRLPGRRRREGGGRRSRAQGREAPSWIRGHPTSGAWPGRRRAGRSGSPKARAWAPGTCTPWTSRVGGGSSTARRASSASSTQLPTAAPCSTVPSTDGERWRSCPAAGRNRT